MKVLQLSIRSKFLMLFIAFTLVFLYASWCLGAGVSAFQISSLKDFTWLHIPFFIVSVMLVRMVYQSNNWSLKLLLVFLLAVSAFNIVYLGRSENKLLLIAAFTYIVFAIHYYYQWSIEVMMAAFTPKYSIYDLDKYKRFPLTVLVKVGSDEFYGKLTNLDEDSLFVRFDSAVDIKFLDKIEVSAIVDNVIFKAKGSICTYFDQGYGIVVDSSTQEKYSWKQFYSVISERAWV
ncbi:MAG: hypothetical protein L6Q33_09885 [Bacteriovoracaceae bacterium]|jgi:hypothetical protein|nr:hypothetical protein [Bacteriovoracaceae bacterium]